MVRTAARGSWAGIHGSSSGTIEAIEGNSFAYAPVLRDARRTILRQFPYALWFKIENDAIVIACLHHKRDIALAHERAAGVIEMGEPEL
jgi:hypothetical protein